MQFVDFGNRDFAEVCDLRLLPTDALIPPALATRGKSSSLESDSDSSKLENYCNFRFQFPEIPSHYPMKLYPAKVHGLRNEFGKNVFDYVHSSTVERPLHGVLKGTWKDEISGQVSLVPMLMICAGPPLC